MMESTLTAAAATLKQNPNLIEAVGNMWDNLTELSKSDPEKYNININCLKKIFHLHHFKITTFRIYPFQT